MDIIKILGIKMCLLFLWIGVKALHKIIERKTKEENRHQMTKQIKKSSEKMMTNVHLHQMDKRIQRIREETNF